MTNIFDAWVIFRQKVKNEDRNDLVKYINNINGTRLTSAAISQYISGQKAAPDNILLLMERDYPDFVSWLLIRSNISASQDSILHLATLLKFPVKR
jgi:hypothetical protein